MIPMLFKGILPMRRWLVLALLLTLSGCGKKVQVQSNSTLVEQDRELYETAMKFLQKNRFTAARLALQTLLDTYQDSEYGPQASMLLRNFLLRSRPFQPPFREWSTGSSLLSS
jgi:outer membrane protein assembly factor BamD (BamD/ComL family)